MRLSVATFSLPQRSWRHRPCRLPHLPRPEDKRTATIGGLEHRSEQSFIHVGKLAGVLPAHKAITGDKRHPSGMPAKARLASPPYPPDRLSGHTCAYSTPRSSVAWPRM